MLPKSQSSFLIRRLKELREKADLTQEQVAEAAAISSIYYRFIETGRRPNVTLAIIEQIAAAYGLPLHEFFAPKLPRLKLKNIPAPPPHYNKLRRKNLKNRTKKD